MDDRVYESNPFTFISQIFMIFASVPDSVPSSGGYSCGQTVKMMMILNFIYYGGDVGF